MLKYGEELRLMRETLRGGHEVITRKKGDKKRCTEEKLEEDMQKKGRRRWSDRKREETEDKRRDAK